MAGSTRGSQKVRDTIDFLRTKISTGEWEVGGLIPREPELIEILGVGRSTIRESVRSLAAFGMLESVPGVGTYVRSRTPVSSILSEFLADHALEEVLVYRRSLEIEASQHAAVNRSETQLFELRAAHEASLAQGQATTDTCIHSAAPHAFHRLIVEASGSKLLLDLYLGVLSVLERAGAEHRVFLGTSIDTMHSDHGALLDAIEARDVRSAAHAMALHVDRDLGLHTDMLEFTSQTERATSLIEAGYDPDRSDAKPER